MMETWFAPTRLFDGQKLRFGQAIRVVENCVAEIGKPPKDGLVLEGCLAPGFVDLQVNGGGGVMLNTTPTKEGIAAIAAAHRQFGTTAIMPTVITDAPEVLDKAAEAALAMKDDEGIVGLHIEGPHISTARRGTHDARFIRPLDERTMNIVARLRNAGVAVMITVAPESTTSDQIATLASLGAIVSIGHTDADAETIEAAIAAGAQCATHLFNAMSPMTGRAPGAVGAILNSNLHSGIICDGYHVDDRMIALALRARSSPDLMFLVTDAMATVGGPERFALYDDHVHLEDGRLVNAEGNLAGAHITQAQGVGRLVNIIGLDLEDALRMAITTPAKVVSQPRLSDLIGQSIDNLVVLSEDLGSVVPFADVALSAEPRNAAE